MKRFTIQITLFSPAFLKVATQTKDAIRQPNDLRHVKELWSFPGLYNFFRRSIPNIALISTETNLKVRKGQEAKFESISGEEKNAL